MKILILYASRNGFGTKCVELLTEQLPKSFDINVCNVCKDESKPTLEMLADYDAIVLGSSVKMGKLQKEIYPYLKNENAFWNKVILCFICCGYTDMALNYAEKLFPSGIRSHCQVVPFGGELNPKKLKGLDKIIINIVKKQIENEGEDALDHGEYTRQLPTMLPENIALAVAVIKNKINKS